MLVLSPRASSEWIPTNMFYYHSQQLKGFVGNQNHEHPTNYSGKGVQLPSWRQAQQTSSMSRLGNNTAPSMPSTNMIAYHNKYEHGFKIDCPMKKLLNMMSLFNVVLSRVLGLAMVTTPPSPIPTSKKPPRHT